MVGLSEHAVEKWYRTGSRGPSDSDICAKLEDFFAISLFKDGENIEKRMLEEENKNMRYSDYVKEKIYASYNLIHNFVLKNL